MTHNLGSRILHCDSACLVVNKIAGEAVEGAVQGMTSLPQALAAELAAMPQTSPDALAAPVAVHRLDVPVSGCVLFARTQTSLRFLNKMFDDHCVQKQYWAIVESTTCGVDTESELVHWIHYDPKRNKSIAYDQAGRGRKKAILRCRLAGKSHHYTFLEIDLITGRHHQIRAQLQRLGIHIKGDLKYGARRSEPNGGIRLHARLLSFPDPLDQNRHITIQAAPPLRDTLWNAFEEAFNAPVS